MEKDRCALAVTAIGLLAALAAGGCAHTTIIEGKGVDVVPLAEIDSYMKGKEDIFADPAHRLVIQVPAGERIPLEISLRLPFAELEGSSPAIRFNRDVFLCIGGGKFLLGLDGRRFAEAGDLEGLKEVAGLERGSLEIGFSVKKAEGAKFTVGLAAE